MNKLVVSERKDLRESSIFYDGDLATKMQIDNNLFVKEA
jgi:hypothetical protein